MRIPVKNTEIPAEELGLALVHIRFLVGAIVLSRALDDLTWQMVAMAALALTVGRIVLGATATIG